MGNAAALKFMACHLPTFHFSQWRYRTRQRLCKVNNIYRRNAEIQGREVSSQGEGFY